MRSIYIILAVLALATQPLEAAKLLRRTYADEVTEDHYGKGKGKSGKGKGKSGDSKSGKGKSGKGKSSSSCGKGGKGKGKSSYEDDEECDDGDGDVPVETGETDPEPECCGQPTNTCSAHEEGQELRCFSNVTDYKVLKTSLGCADADEQGFAGTPVVTVYGPDGVLDCSGHGDNQIYDPTPESSSSSIGIRLVNGGKLINCHVAGFEVGVEMSGQGNNAIIGSTIYDVQIGIETSPATELLVTSMVPDVGCYSVSCTKVYGAEFDGILVQHGGQMLITDTSVLSADANGIHILPRSLNGALYVALSNVNVFGTNQAGANGILVGSVNNDVAHGLIEVEIYELTKIIGSGQNGYYQIPSYPETSMYYGAIETTVIGGLDVQGSRYHGIAIEGGTWSVGECGLVEACTSQTNTDEPDIDALVNPDIRKYVDVILGDGGEGFSEDNYFVHPDGRQYCEISAPTEVADDPVCQENFCSTDIAIALACSPPPPTDPPVEPDAVPAGADGCDVCRQPRVLTFMYTGVDVGMRQTVQGKAEVEDSGASLSSSVSATEGSPCAMISVSGKKSSKDDLTVSTTSGTARICPGDYITVSTGDDKLPTEVNMDLDWGPGSQYISYHASCSSPIIEGDMVGVLQVVGFRGQDADCGFGLTV